jgi:hypothetical protein
MFLTRQKDALKPSLIEPILNTAVCRAWERRSRISSFERLFRANILALLLAPVCAGHASWLVKKHFVLKYPADEEMALADWTVCLPADSVNVFLGFQFINPACF